MANQDRYTVEQVKQALIESDGFQASATDAVEGIWLY